MLKGLRFAFIGSGAMAEAMIRGLVERAGVPGQRITGGPAASAARSCASAPGCRNDGEPGGGQAPTSWSCRSGRCCTVRLTSSPVRRARRAVLSIVAAPDSRTPGVLHAEVAWDAEHAGADRPRMTV
jgi:hypothetical protein